jgi:hypothetical protein
MGAQFGEGAVFLEPAQVVASGGAAKRRTSMVPLTPSLSVVVHGGGSNSQSVAQVGHSVAHTSGSGG